MVICAALSSVLQQNLVIQVNWQFPTVFLHQVCRAANSLFRVEGLQEGKTILVNRTKWLVGLFGAVSVAMMTGCSQIPTSSNSLAVGEADDRPGPIDISLNSPAALNFQSKQAILDRRTAIVNRYSYLLRKPYVPTPFIFDQIVDKRPWWGMQGTFVWGAGERSIEGDAEESRFMLNPLLLVGANSGTALIWDTKKIVGADFKGESFPYCWLPDSLKWYPAQGLVQATYNVSAFNQALTARSAKLTAKVEETIKFGLVAYNARDFGLNYIYLDPARSLNVVPTTKDDSPVLIKQMIHCGNSCKYPGGCNNMSPAQKEIDHFDCSKLPARANIRLWKKQPFSKDDKPDLTYFIDMR